MTKKELSQGEEILYGVIAGIAIIVTIIAICMLIPLINEL
jgi:cell division protein FtsL